MGFCPLVRGIRMKCGYPLEIINIHGKRKVSCGQCMPCRINKKREWKGRLLLEAAHTPSDGSFVTLTYAPEHLPENGSLVVSDPQGYMKRLRHKVPEHIRYFCVGEYGSESWRPHYHLILFNVDPLQHEQAIIDSWQGKGIVDVGVASTGALNYVTDYTTKRLTLPDDPRLGDRNREFFLSSRRPPIGHHGYIQLLDALYTRRGARFIAESGDVPNAFRFDGRVYPLSYRWRSAMRRDLGIKKTIGDKAFSRIIELSKSQEQFLIDRLRAHDEAEKAEKNAAKLWNTRKRDRKKI